jgi:hypothetical protein
MQEPHGEGLGSHTGAESCVVSRKAGREALTGRRGIEPRYIQEKKGGRRVQWEVNPPR